ncbi:MAG: chemotaxis protein CheW [Candidatus Hydrogenedentes bacterium]|nr:chemotaxis protein CheW [Candidatus Hydrogenedentota bacterium]
MSEFFNDSLISDFVTESREHLDAIEPDLLGMEESSDVAPETINRVFRAIHSIKGGAGFLAYDSLKHLSHSMENVLMMVRDGELSINPVITDVLLRGVDKLRAMVDDIQGSEGVPCAEELADLKKIIDGGRSVVDHAAPVAEAGLSLRDKLDLLPYDPAEVARILSHGRFLFVADVLPAQDLAADDPAGAGFAENAAALGDVLCVASESSVLDSLEAALATREPFCFLFSTVLEPSLIGTALELPEEQVASVTTDLLGPPAQTPAPEPVKAAPEVPTAPTTVPDEIAAVSEAVSDAGTAPPPAESGEVRKADVADTLRVRVDLLTRLMNSAGELVLARNQLLRVMESHAQTIPGLSGILQNIDHVTTDVQEGIMQTRMQPIGAIFGKFPRVVRDMARTLGKDIAITMEGNEVELDKSILESLSDPMTHIIRNCADHALEPPSERKAKGKNPQGTIQLRAYHEAGQVNISIRDDGRGIDPEKVSRKAIEKGVVTREQASRMSSRELVNLVFAPGFSTAEVVSDVSGRGVGMDVVRSNIEKLGGTVQLDTAVNKGTTVLLQLPLTLAIIPSLIVGVQEHRFAVPQVNVEEFVWVRAEEVAKRIEKVQGQDVLRLRGMLLPLLRLSDVLAIPRRYADLATGERRDDQRQRIADRRSMDMGAEALQEDSVELQERGATRRTQWRSDYNIVVSRIGGNRFGMIVDELFDTEEIVVKPLSCFLKQSPCFSGATILGDGRVITILDMAGVADAGNLHFSDVEAEEQRRREEEARREARARAARRSVIIFNASPDEYFAVAQDTVLRLERLQVRDIKVVGDQEYLEYRGHGLPLIRLEQYLPVRPLPEAETLYMIIPRQENGVPGTGSSAGILVSRIVDAVDVEVNLREAERSGPGLEGTAIVNDQLTLFLDPGTLIASTGVHERIS